MTIKHFYNSICTKIKILLNLKKSKVMGKLNEIYEVDVVYKRPAITSMKNIKGCEEAVELFRELITEEKIDLKEFFLVALLTRNNNILGVSKIGMGATNGTSVNVKEIVQLAAKTNASGVILCHNHPSGNLKASDNDILLTKRIKEVCSICDITLLDHIILTSESHNSIIDDI